MLTQCNDVGYMKLSISCVIQSALPMSSESLIDSDNFYAYLSSMLISAVQRASNISTVIFGYNGEENNKASTILQVI